jgi:hypothetical protein
MSEQAMEKAEGLIASIPDEKERARMRDHFSTSRSLIQGQRQRDRTPEAARPRAGVESWLRVKARAAAALRRLRTCPAAERTGAIREAAAAAGRLDRDGYEFADYVSDLVFLVPPDLMREAGEALITLIQHIKSDETRAALTIEVASVSMRAVPADGLQDAIGKALGYGNKNLLTGLQIFRAAGDNPMGGRDLRTLLRRISGKRRPEALKAISVLAPLLTSGGGSPIADGLYHDLNDIVRWWP